MVVIILSNHTFNYNTQHHSVTQFLSMTSQMNDPQSSQEAIETVINHQKERYNEQLKQLYDVGAFGSSQE